MSGGTSQSCIVSECVSSDDNRFLVAIIYWLKYDMPCTCRCYDRPTLDRFARHYQTGELLPDDLFQKLVAARTFRRASSRLPLLL